MKEKLTIAFVSTTAITVDAFLLNHIEKLTKNYNLIIICNDAKSLKKKVPKNVKLHNLDFFRKPNLLVDIKILMKLTYRIIKSKPTLTISLSPKAGFLNSLSAYFAGVPYRIHWFTGQVWVTKNGLVKKFYKIIDKIIFNLSTHVLVDSHSQRKFLLLNNIISKNKSTVLLDGSVGGVNLRRFKFNNLNRDSKRRKLKIQKNDFVFLYLGRINKDKGVVDLINAFKLIQKIQKAFLILVGNMEENNIFRLIRNNKQIIYVGKTNKPEKWFSIADIFCLPSYREGFGSTIIEAAACNLPTLGSNIYGISDAIIKNQTGFFHQAGDVNDIKKKMLFIIENRKLIKKYGYKARKRVEEKFNENLISNKLLNFINSKIN